ncbi:GLE1-like protein-domain-containing protein [Clohesyomyces aquaticus]|uniref:mRNA export factor GLE1 n=1 Tax=Clohesyomyces aquaticus TaxID=1231657 RepID=A0A1Y1ZZA1_9PLEO|nr:GLE1-like protein-domain-containing protein [Clohesyomyces aquaticus]
MAVFFELSQMLVTSDRDSQNRLDLVAATHASDHHEQLVRAALEHERIREGAERELERLTLESLQVQKAKQEAELQRLKEDQLRRRQIEQLQLENARREAELVQFKQAEEHRSEDERIRIENTKRELLEKARREAQAKDRTIQQQKQIEQTPQQAPQQPTLAPAAQAPQPQLAAPVQAPLAVQQQQARIEPQPATATASGSTNSNVEEVHKGYLQLHERMKAFRKSFPKEFPAGHPTKPLVGDTRREMRLRMGQITTDRKDSKVTINRMRDILNKCLKSNGPPVDIRQYIVSSPIPAGTNDSNARYPALLLYAWICFGKSLVKQFEQEAASEDGKIIQELGLIAASLISDPNYAWNGISMKDILLAKYHKACPMLFGISGRMDTKEGQKRLGWMILSGVEPTANVYNQRMSGLGAGFAAMSLRSFSGKVPAISVSDYWLAIASICNTPPEALYGGHFMLLKGLTKDYANKFVIMYGRQATAVLRRAVIDLPARAPARAQDTAKVIDVLPDVWRTTFKLVLD